MVAPSIPKDELARLADLLSYDILDTPPEEELNEIVQLAADICNMPISTISLIDENRQWFKAKKGLEKSETAREFAFCAHAIHGEDIMMVPNALEDERFADNPLVAGEPNIRFYAGVPLKSDNGHNLGTLCVIGTKPDRLSDSQKRALEILARQVVTHFELRKKNRSLQAALKTVDQQKVQLANHNQVLTRLLSIISHDLRSPIDNLKQLFSMFIEGALTRDELGTLSAELNKGLATTSDLLNNLLSWASSQLKESNINIVEVDVNELVDEQFSNIEQAARLKKNALINKVEPGLSISADKDILRFVVRNLAVNANKFTSGGKIMVDCRQQGASIVLSVSDTGCGMSAERIARLANWKNRQSTLGTNGEKGSGLGLLITRQFAEQHGGKLIIESEEGVGTTVKFEIPLKPLS